MSLNGYAAEKRLAILEDLRRGVPPREGEFDGDLMKEARSKGQPQLGATRYEPQAILVEFIYPDPNGAPILFTVRLVPPERIVFMPVPSWVVESIWQGEIDGSYQFESDAVRLLGEFQSLLAPEPNAPLFKTRAPVGRS